MWEGLIILGLAAAGCVTAIVLKALDVVEKFEAEKKGFEILEPAMEKELESQKNLVDARVDELEKAANKLERDAAENELEGFFHLQLRDLAAARELRQRAAKLRES